MIVMYSNCQIMDHIYSDLLVKTPKQVTYRLPAELGTGAIHYTTTRNNIMMLDVKSAFHADIPIYGTSLPEYLNLFFCFRDSMAWEVKNRPGSVCIQKGESYIYRGHGLMECSEYQKDRDYHFAGFKIPWTSLLAILHRVLSEQETAACQKRMAEIVKVPVSPEMEEILIRLMELPPPASGLESLYFEGQLLTLLSLYFQAILETSPAEVISSISRTDRTALFKLKQQIDSRPDDVPNCSHLARQVHMSPSKFSKAFLALFGMPVHTYVISRRLEEAARLLSETDLTVSQISARVGYAKPSNFSAAFKKIYGTGPKDYKKRIWV